VRINYDVTSGNKVQIVAGITSIGRVALGAAAFFRPETLPRALGVDRGTARRSAVMVRFFAGREAALGLGALHALRTGRDVTPWVIAQAIGDAGDALALAAAVKARHVGPVRGVAVALAAVSGVAGAVLAVRTHRR
jgi:hypothetical protein